MAYTYNATTDYIRFSDDSALENLHKGAFTCACWAKQDGNQYYQRYFARAGSSTTRDWDLSGKNQSYRRLIMKVNYSTTNAYAESVDNAVPNNVWNHLCGTWDGSGIPTLYANGTEPSYLTQTSPAGTRQDSTGVYLYIGNLDTHTRAPSADMHSNALWNVELSADEVAALANGASPLFIRPTNLVFYTPLTNHANDIIGERAPETISGATGGAEQNITVYGGPIYVPSAAAVVGGTFNKTSADTFSFTDTDSETAAFAGAITESFAFADTPSETAVFQRVVSEALALSDTATESAIFIRALAETLALSDATTGSTGLAVFVAESLVFADTVTEAAAFAAAVTEALGLTDTATETGVLLRAVIDALILTDAATGEGGEEIPTAETRGGLSMSLQQMRRMERAQLLAMLREDDAVIASLVASYLRRGKRLN